MMEEEQEQEPELHVFEKNLNSPIHSGSEDEDQHMQQLLESDEVEVDIVTRKEKGKKNKEELKKDMSLVSIVALVVGAIIGSGIFFTPPAVLRNSGSFVVSTIVWSLGALLAVAGGLCYCELALLMKNSGGDYWYLKQVYQFGRLKKVCCTPSLPFFDSTHPLSLLYHSLVQS